MLKQIIKSIQYSWKQILLFEIIFRTSWYAVFSRLIGYGIQFSLDQKGFSYLTAENFKKFVQSPWTVLVFVLTILFFLLAVLFELSAILACYEFSTRLKPISVSEMIYQGVHKTKKLITENIFSWWIYIVLLLPFIGVYYIVEESIRVKFIHYIWKSGYELLPGKAAAGAVILLFLFFSFIMLLIVPYSLTFGGRLRENTRNCILFIRSQKWHVLVFVLCWQMMVFLLLIIFYGIGCLAAVAYVNICVDDQTALSTLIVISEHLQRMAGVMSGGAGAVLNGALLYQMTIKVEITEKFVHPLPYKKKLGRKIAKVLVLVMFMTSVLVAWESVYDYTDSNRNIYVTTQVTAHRGAAKSAPENTMAAVENAINKLSDYVEIDVQETKDGNVVLLHDNSLKRTTGFDADIWTVDYEDVLTLDAGTWFEKEYEGEQVPTLQEVLEYCKGKMDVNIEVKYNGHNKDIVEKVVGLVEEEGMENQCVITSMHYSFLKKVKSLNEKLTTGYIMAMAYGDVERLVYADFLSTKYTYVTDKFVTDAHESGKEVHVWTVNSKYNMKRMMMLNVDNIITDRPELAVRVMAEEAGQETYMELLKYVLGR